MRPFLNATRGALHNRVDEVLGTPDTALRGVPRTRTPLRGEFA